jgi:hypothetical protein
VSTVRIAPLSLIVLFTLGVLCSAASAQAPGLPRTYDVVRVDSPTAGNADTFGFGVVNGGDLNGDGVDDLLTSQGTRILNDGTGAENGEVLVVSGADGSIIRTIAAPEPETATGTGLTEDRAAAFGFYVGSIGRNGSGAIFTDLSSCPGGNTDADPFCDAATVGPPDGIPDIVASALFVNRTSGAAADGVAEDIGRVYVIDGATFSVVKRLDMPQADVDDLADETEQLSATSPAARARPWYGRTVLNPMGRTPCAGDFGVGPCAATAEPIRRGDLDGAGLPDIVVGASAYKYEEAEGTNPACNDTAAIDTCIRSGRMYMFRGENIVGTSPDTALSTPAWNIVNPYAQADVDNPSTRIVNQLELFGHSVAPIGDIGTCNSAPNAAGFCPSAQLNATPDGKPDVLVSAFRVDYPTSGPDNEENYDVGVAVALDGATGAVLQTYRHPDPDTGSIFGFTVTSQPAVGNAGGTGTPDIYIPAAGQDTDEYRGEGMGFMLNGAFLVTGNNVDLQRFRSPKPATGLGYGTTAAGVGNVYGDNVFNEILIGAFPGRGISHVAFHDPITGAALQTIDDPDQQELSAFGVGLAPMGDVNGDGFLDFASSAARFDRAGVTDAGRIYIMRSNNTPLPAAPPPPPPPPPPAPVTEVAAVAGRTLELVTSRTRVRRGSSVGLTGALEAFANAAGCQAGQEVEIQRRAVKTAGYATITRVRTDASGNFSAAVPTDRTSYFRARVAQTAACAGAVSAREQVEVTPSIRVLTSSARLSSSRQIRLQVDCRTDDGPCNGTVKLRTVAAIGGRKRTLPTASFQAPGNRRRSVTITVGSSTAALLRRAGRVSMRAYVVGRDALGNSTAVVARVTVRTR